MLIGYNITEILLDVFSCVLNMPKLRTGLQKNLAGIVDARWILGRAGRKMSLRDLLAQVSGNSQDPDNKYLTQDVVKLISMVCFSSSWEKKVPFALTFTPSLLMNLLTKDINMDSDMFQSYDNESIKQEADEEVLELEEIVGDGIDKSHCTDSKKTG